MATTPPAQAPTPATIAAAAAAHIAADPAANLTSDVTSATERIATHVRGTLLCVLPSGVLQLAPDPLAFEVASLA